MPLLLPTHKSRLLPVCSFVLCCFTFNLLANMDKALVESTILINLQEFPRSKIERDQENQRRLSAQESTSIQDAVDKDKAILSDITPLTNSLSNTFSTFTGANLIEALEYSILYLSNNKTNFNLTDNDLLAGIKSSIIAYIRTSETKGEDLENTVNKLPEIVFNSLIPVKVKSWNGSVPNWSKDLSLILMDSINESNLNSNTNTNVSLQKTIAKSSVTALLKILSESTVSADGFTKGLSNVSDTRADANDEMLFGGTPNFMKFSPEKTRFLEFAAKGLADGLFKNPQDIASKENIMASAEIVSSGTMEGAIEFISTLEGDNSLFAYEATKALSTGLTLSAVYNTSSTAESRDLLLPESAAESISQEIAFSVISSSLDKGYDLKLNRLAESVSFGTAMGAQLASVLDKSWNYEDGWELYSRNSLAKATAKGSANGSINAASKYIENNPEIDDTNTKTTRREILDVASGSALGSLIGNTGLAVYYPTIMQPIINHSAQGATTGGITANNLSMVDKPKGVTEEFEIEIARALAHGAAQGALFQIVGLKNDSMPDKRTYDFETISAAEAVSYGSTYGAITGGIQSGEDGLIIKQAIYQGTTEGATVGASLALGYDKSVADLVDLKSSIAIKSAIKKTNDEAAVKANSTMAVKTIQTSSQDMLLLMRKFNINPLYTNPTRIFSNPNAVEEESLPFKDKFPVASPI